MDALELVKELEVQRAENQTLRNDLTKALESLEQANARIKHLEGQVAEHQALHNTLAKALESLEQAHARIKHLEGQAAKDSHKSSKPPSTDGGKRADPQNGEPARKERQKEWRAARSSWEHLNDGGAP